MNKAVLVIVALVGGFIGGVVLSEIIGIFGKFVFGYHAGIKFLPVYTAIACAVLAPVVYRRKWK
ncbi:MAG TPA: DUF5957 family protein [Bacilli bacterium]